MARDKRPFGTIRKLPSGRYQAMYTNPAQRRVTAPHTFATRIDAEGWLHQRRVEIEAGRWNPAANVKKPKTTFGAYATSCSIDSTARPRTDRAHSDKRLRRC